ncbi:MAG TPA: lyase family protein [Trebonia sp.]|nr:lyase family protein [Trebonia sp.]
MADQTAWPAGYPAGDDGPASPLAVTGLFAGVFDHGTAATGDAAWFQALLQAEAGLARALERAGRAPAGSGAAVTEAATVNGFSAAEVAEVARASALTGNPVPGLARVLARRVPDFAAPAVHQGATSQDIMDTAAMLLARSSLEAAARDVAAAAEAAARLAREHAGTLMIGRTLLQQAVPVTFGLVAAGWLDGLDSGAAGLAVASRRLAVQFGGAAGTLASLGADGPRVAALLGQELGLAVPPLPWHTERLRVIDVAMALARVTATLGKIARDVILLAQSEVGEASEGGEGGGGAGGPRRGGSSAMPNKANPVASVAILGCARQVPGLLATLVASAEHEHQRAAGAWHAEWEPFTAVLRLAGSAAAWGAELLGDLRVDPARMAANLAATGGLPLAERVTGLLAGALGRPAAHDLVAGAAARAVAAGRPLREELLGLPEVGQAGITAGQVDEALDPAGYVGAAARFTAAALRAHEEQLACAGGREPR